MRTQRLGKDAQHIRDLITAELAVYGISHYRLGRNRKHPVVEFDAVGQHFKFTFPGSPSDHRSALNTRTELRRLCEKIGLRPVVKTDRPERP